MKRTKIIATLGPATEEKSVIRDLMDAGLNVARLNCSHGRHAQYKKIVQAIRELEKETGKRMTILMDLQGPKIRLGEIPEGKILVQRGDKITFSTKIEENSIHLPYPALPKVVKGGQSLLIDDGLIRTKILFVKGHRIHVLVMNTGLIRSRKGVNLPDATLPKSEFLNAKDKKDLAFGLKILRVNAVAASFVETAEDLEYVRKEIQKHTKRPVTLVAKIERPKALKNLGKIVEAADAVMVARGDLAIETKAEAVPIYQKKIIEKSRLLGKPVIVATQMLQSMVESPIATRAEVSDAATAIFEHADAFMLSNETAVGSYPVKAVQTLARVARATEKEIFKTEAWLPIPPQNDDDDLAQSACALAESVNAKAMVVFTRYGATAKALLKQRPRIPVHIFTPNESTADLLNLVWGAHAIVCEKTDMKKMSPLKKGDTFVYLELTPKKRKLVVQEA